MNNMIKVVVAISLCIFVINCANPTSSITTSTSCLFCKINYVIPGASEDSILSFVMKGNYFYASGYSYSSGLTNGQDDFMIYKISSTDGSKVWAKYYGSDKQERGYSIDVDSSQTYAIVGGITTKTGTDNSLVINLSASDGSLSWYKVYGNGGIVQISSVNINSNSIFCIGYIVDSGSGNFPDILVMKLSSSDGSTAWAKRFGDSSYDYGIDYQVDYNANKFWVGATSQSTRLSNGGADMVLIRLTISDGTRDACRYFGNTSDENLVIMIKDTSGSNMYIGGITSTTAWSQGLNDFLVVKYSLTSESISWIGTMGSTQDDYLTSISYYDSDSTKQGIYIVGYSSGLSIFKGGSDIIVIKLDSTTLAISWQLFLGGSVNDYAYSSLIDSSTGSLIIAGKSNSIFNSTVSNGSNDGFIFSIDYQGRNQCSLLGITLSSAMFTMTTRSTSTYKFTDTVPTVDSTISSSASTSQTVSSLALGTSTINTSTLCKQYIPVEPIGFPVNQVAFQGLYYEYSIPQFCYDPSSSIYYTITQSDGSTLPSWLTFDASSFKISGYPVSVSKTSYTILVKVALNSDSTVYRTVSFSLYINTKPIVKNPIPDVSSKTGIILFVDIPVSTFYDADGDTLTVTVTQKPSFMFYSDNRIYGTPTDTDVGEHTVIVSCSDPYSGSVTNTFYITITKNYYPVVITKIPNQSIPKNTFYTYTIPQSYFSDANSDPLTISMDNTNYSWLSLDTSTWKISGTPTADYEYTVTVKVSDPYNGYVTSSFTLIVGTGIPNNAPTVKTSISKITINYSQSFTKSLGTNLFYDADGDLLTYTLKYSNGSAIPTWMSFDQSTLYIYGTVPSSSNLNGLSQMDLVLTATDTKGASGTSSFTVSISESTSNSSILTIIVIGAVVAAVLLVILTIALVFTYRYCHKKTKGRVHVEEQLETEKQNSQKDDEVNIDHIEPKMDSCNELPMETQREMKDTENAPSSAVSEEDENENAFIENMTKLIITGNNQNNLH